jgi:hypothetical protein
MHDLKIVKHRCMHYLSMKENWSQYIALFNTFFFIPLRWKLQLRQGLKLCNKIQNDIYIMSNLLLDFFIRLTWHHFNYSHISIHYNHERINVIKMKKNPL